MKCVNEMVTFIILSFGFYVYTSLFVHFCMILLFVLSKFSRIAGPVSLQEKK